MTTTFTQTFNRDDIRRVYASFSADYRIVAEWTELHSPAFVDRTIEEIKALAEGQYLKEVHLQLRSSTGAVREAAVYRVSTNAAGWSADRPGDLYWDARPGDRLRLIVFFTDAWWDLAQSEREAFLPGWEATDFDGDYGAMAASADRRYASRAYGLERMRYTS